jgi:hypothetical protein
MINRICSDKNINTITNVIVNKINIQRTDDSIEKCKRYVKTKLIELHNVLYTRNKQSDPDTYIKTLNNYCIRQCIIDFNDLRQQHSHTNIKSKPNVSFDTRLDSIDVMHRNKDIHTDIDELVKQMDAQRNEEINNINSSTQNKNSQEDQPDINELVKQMEASRNELLSTTHEAPSDIQQKTQDQSMTIDHNIIHTIVSNQINMLRDGLKSEIINELQIQKNANSKIIISNESIILSSENGILDDNVLTYNFSKTINNASDIFVNYIDVTKQSIVVDINNNTICIGDSDNILNNGTYRIYDLLINLSNIFSKECINMTCVNDIIKLQRDDIFTIKGNILKDIGFDKNIYDGVYDIESVHKLSAFDNIEVYLKNISDKYPIVKINNYHTTASNFNLDSDIEINKIELSTNVNLCLIKFMMSLNIIIKQPYSS